MYHVGGDRRCSRSARLIYDGLVACLGQKPFERVTVSDIQRESGVARSTFYRCFDNLSDVLAWRCDQCFAEVLSSIEPSAFEDERGIARRYFSFWARNHEVLDVIVRIDRPDIAFASHRRVARAMRKLHGVLPGTDLRDGDYFIAVRTAFTLSMLMTWAERGRRETVDELLDIVDKQISLLARGRDDGQGDR